MARQGKETIESIERDIKKNYSKRYFSNRGLTEDSRAPAVIYVEPAKLLERFKRARRYVWMVTIDGSSQGVYENAASSCLFSTEDEAIDFVQENLSEIVADNVLGGVVLNFNVLGSAIEKHCKWFGKYEAQFRDGDSVTDFRIEMVAVPNPPERNRKK